jgi:hypothetical protein
MLEHTTEEYSTLDLIKVQEDYAEELYAVSS